MLPQTVVPRGTKGQGIVLWSSGRKPLLFDAIRVNTTIRFLKGTGENPNPLGLGVCQWRLRHQGYYSNGSPERLRWDQAL